MPCRFAAAALLLPVLLFAPVARADPPTAADFSGRRARFLATVTEQATQNGLPPALADAVATVESGYEPGALGEDGEVGLMQILPATAAMLGFRGTDAALAEPEVNIHYGVAYLARAWTLANGNVCRALMKYRAGHGEEQMTALSATYCRRALTHLASIGSPLASGPGAPLPSGGDEVTRCGRPLPPVALTGPERVRLRRGQRSEADSLRLWQAQAARLRVLRACLTRRPAG